jgi:HSP20 family protein
MADKRTSTTREERGMERSSNTDRSSSALASRSANPFSMLDRFAEEMDRVFENFGFGWLRSRQPGGGFGLWPGGDMWTPELEIFQRDPVIAGDVRRGNDALTLDQFGKFFRRAFERELVRPVAISDTQVTIEGERQRHHDEEREGFYRSERSYGRFYRTIPLPEGVIADQAKATFKDGVLEVTIPAPPESARRGRRLEISEGSSAGGNR